jgi:hypothetical protein
MNETLVRAIRERRVVSFEYNGRARVVEPQCYGVGSKGTELLRALQVQDRETKEALFDVAKMHDLCILDRRFVDPGQHYRPNDSAMVTVFAQLSDGRRLTLIQGGLHVKR